MSRKALGRGLNALFPQVTPFENDLMELDIDRIDPALVQPRGVFREDKLEELALSIRHNESFSRSSCGATVIVFSS
jgi:hypothetical protein